jgi:hypothetical protein
VVSHLGHAGPHDACFVFLQWLEDTWALKRGQGQWNVDRAASLAYRSRDVRSIPSCSSAPIEFALVSRPLSEGVHAPREKDT